MKVLDLTRTSDLPVVCMTQADLDALDEYSCSIPTGTRIGKRWKKNLNGYMGPSLDMLDPFASIPHGRIELRHRHEEFFEPEWVMGEYAESGKAGTVLVRWSRVVITPSGKEEPCQ